MAKQAVLDTSFILSCIRRKIDFIDEAESQGLTLVVPNQVMFELRGISNTNDEAALAIKILKKKNIAMIDLNTKETDQGIINYAKENPRVIIATLDAEIKNAVPNNKLVIRGKKRLAIV